jgi:hypothetical protein
MISFRRSLAPGEEASWAELLGLLQDKQLEEGDRDTVTWALDNSKTFTTKSLYRFVTHRGVCIPKAENVWKSKLPLKIKVFLWQMKHDKLQVATSLKKRGWKGVYTAACVATLKTRSMFP